MAKLAAWFAGYQRRRAIWRKFIFDVSNGECDQSTAPLRLPQWCETPSRNKPHGPKYASPVWLNIRARERSVNLGRPGLQENWYETRTERRDFQVVCSASL